MTCKKCGMPIALCSCKNDDHFPDDKWKSISKTPSLPCSYCGGRGTVYFNRFPDHGMHDLGNNTVCLKCGGSGKA